MQPPYGPHKISQNGQLSLPKELLVAADLRPGDSVYVLVNDELPGTVLLVPLEMGARWFEAGRAQHKSAASAGPTSLR